MFVPFDDGARFGETSCFKGQLQMTGFLVRVCRATLFARMGVLKLLPGFVGSEVSSCSGAMCARSKFPVLDGSDGASVASGAFVGGLRFAI